MAWVWGKVEVGENLGDLGVSVTGNNEKFQRVGEIELAVVLHPVSVARMAFHCAIRSGTDNTPRQFGCARLLIGCQRYQELQT